MSGSAETPRGDTVRAVAVRYDESSLQAPEVVAKGVGEVAQRIVAAAESAGVPVHADADLAELLSACHLGDEIPAELYSAIAELLTWLYGINAALAQD